MVALAAAVLGACTPPGLPAPQPPDRTAVSPSVAADAQAITVGVDGPVTGFNPYLVADFSPAARAVSSLVLPSVSVIGASGSRTFDRDVVTSAAVTSRDPFTVSYQLNRGASWSDGTPVTAEDFRYLQQQVPGAVGGVGGAGYRHITAIDSTDAGKRVEVVFDAAVADWPSLFSPLLPAHILRDAPGGFAGALSGGIPVSAGPLRVTSVDRVTGLISLSRNDKFWGTQPGPNSLVLRMGTPAELVAALERGDVQAVFARPGRAVADRLAAVVPQDRRVDVPLPATVQLVMGTRSGPTAVPAVRRAIAAGLSPEVLADAVSGSRAAGLLPVRSMLRLPAEATASETDSPDVVFANPAAATAELRRAGYVTGGLYATLESQPLRLTLGYRAGEERTALAARVVQQQLGRIGIEVDLVGDTAVVDRIAAGELDLALVTVPRGPSDALAAASMFGCPSDVDRPGGNLGGYCNPRLGPLLEGAMAGRSATPIDALLWADLPVIPLGEPSAVFAVAPELTSVVAGAGPGWLFTGPLAGASGWPPP